MDTCESLTNIRMSKSLFRKQQEWKEIDFETSVYLHELVYLSLSILMKMNLNKYEHRFIGCLSYFYVFDLT